MQLIKNFLANDIVERALKTFVQAFLATLAVGVMTVDSFETAQALLVGAIGAGISAAWNGIKAKK